MFFPQIEYLDVECNLSKSITITRASAGLIWLARLGNHVLLSPMTPESH